MTEPRAAAVLHTPHTPHTPRNIATAQIRAALIDLDGTLVDTAQDFTAALNGMLTKLGARPVDRAEVLLYIGKGSENLIARVLAARFDATQAQALFQQAFDRYQTEYASVNGRYTQLYPEVKSGLDALRAAGIKLACVTNKPHRFAVELLQHYGLLEYFALVYGGDSWPRKKPDPMPMIEACRALGVAAAHTVAIGDSENDALAAAAGGLWSLTVPYGYNHGQPVQTIPADGIVENLLQAAHLIVRSAAPH